MNYKIDFAELNGILKNYARIILPKILPRGEFNGSEYVALNPTRYDRHFGSFRINSCNMVWCDFATNDKGKGFISLYCYLKNLKPFEAALDLANNFNIALPERISNKWNKETDNNVDYDPTKLINKIWQSSSDANGTIVEKYLRSRGIIGYIPPTIRYLPNCKHNISGTNWACMLAAITINQDLNNQQSNIVALHRTYLEYDGSGKAPIEPAKMRLGTVYGGAVKLANSTDQLILAEGIETAMSVSLLANRNLRYGVWAVLSATGYLNLLLPPLPFAATIIIAADNDSVGIMAAEQAATKWSAEGRKVKIVLPPANMDFNDVLMSSATKAAY